MLRTIWLTMQNEARLLVRDPIVLGMLLLAPVVIIVVAGYSLGNLYGAGAGVFQIPVVDRDRGEVGAGILAALKRESSIVVEPANDLEQARRMVLRRDRVPMAIEIPAGTTRAVREGGPARLIAYVDPVKRVEVNAIELRLDRLCREITARAQAEARRRLQSSQARLGEDLRRLVGAISEEQHHARAEAEHARAETLASIKRQIDGVRERLTAQLEATAHAREQEIRSALTAEIARRQQVLVEIRQYLTELKTRQHQFEQWLAELKQMAGKHGGDIPPPPAFPAPPPNADLAELSKPIAIPPSRNALPTPTIPELSIKLPALPQLPGARLVSELNAFNTDSLPPLPGQLGLDERPAIEGAAVGVNAFDQYVPGFGVTFLMIGMLLGISLTLFDEQEWGTLRRLRATGAPLSGILLGKLIARFIVGTIQMVVLFAIGWALFGISLGRDPAALLLPSAGISFASAAFGLAITPLARSHDGVMPLGTVTAMAMSAVGGCWWPIGFEPSWMRAAARWLPTTWTMRAYNDLMIRNLPAASALWPLAATLGIGVFFLVAGLCAMIAREKSGG